MEELITLNQLKIYDAEKTNHLNVQFNNVYNYVDDGFNNAYNYIDNGFNKVNVQFNEAYNYIDNGFNNVNVQFNDAYNYIDNGLNNLSLDVANLQNYVDDGFNNVNNQFNNAYNYIDTELDKKIDKTEKGEANGVATLDATGRVPYSQLPESAMEYKGTWDASTNTPSLADGTGTNGDFYVVSVGGTVNFGSRTVTFYVNDRVIYDGTTHQWERLPAGEVRSVNGFTGDVTLTASDVGAATSTDITNAINALDVTDTVVTGKYVSAVSETDGKISVTRANLPVVDQTYSGTSTNAQSGVAVKQAIDALDVTDSAQSGKYVSAVSETDGKISVTRASLPTIPTVVDKVANGNMNAVTSNAVYDYVDAAITQVLNTGF